MDFILMILQKKKKDKGRDNMRSRTYNFAFFFFMRKTYNITATHKYLHKFTYIICEDVKSTSGGIL